MGGLRWSDKQLQAHLSGRLPAAAPSSNVSKHRARATYFNGIRFPSKLQAKHCQQLDLLKAGGIVKFYLREIRFDLPGGTHHRLDWLVVLMDERLVWAESKGRDLRPGQIKRRQVEEIYGITIRVWTRDVEL